MRQQCAPVHRLSARDHSPATTLSGCRPSLCVPSCKVVAIVVRPRSASHSGTVRASTASASQFRQNALVRSQHSARLGATKCCCYPSVRILARIRTHASFAICERCMPAPLPSPSPSSATFRGVCACATIACCARTALWLHSRAGRVIVRGIYNRMCGSESTWRSRSSDGKKVMHVLCAHACISRRRPVASARRPLWRAREIV